MKRRLILLAAIVSTLLMIRYPQLTVSGAREGVDLCARTVIPSLFPFIFLTSLICAHSDLLRIPCLNKICKIAGVPVGCETIFLLGFIGGYPIGARCVYEAYKDGRISKPTAQRMIGFCNNAGPSFIFGVLSAAFTKQSHLWLIWTIQILSGILTGCLLKKGQTAAVCSISNKRISITDALLNSLRAIASICGWIILFRIVYKFLDYYILSQCNAVILTVLTGMLELTNGCLSLTAITSEKLRFVVCSTMLCFGGACVSLQTKSVVGDLGCRKYICGKMIQTLICLLLSILMSYIFL